MGWYVVGHDVPPSGPAVSLTPPLAFTLAGLDAPNGQVFHSELPLALDNPMVGQSFCIDDFQWSKVDPLGGIREIEWNTVGASTRICRLAPAISSAASGLTGGFNGTLVAPPAQPPIMQHAVNHEPPPAPASSPRLHSYPSYSGLGVASTCPLPQTRG